MSFPLLLNRCLSLSNGFITLPRTAKICDCCSQPLCSYSAALLEAILQHCNSAARFVRVVTIVTVVNLVTVVTVLILVNVVTGVNVLIVVTVVPVVIDGKR